jgi:alcohol dehydrogenase
MSARESLLLTAPRMLAWVSEELPVPGPGEVLVRTIAGAVSVGSELPFVRGDGRHARRPEYPLMTGYESLGVVEACGPHVSTLAPSDRVVAFYGHRTAAVLPERRAVPVPRDIPDDLALLLVLACDTAKGVAKVAPPAGEAVLVAGAGAIGLLTLFNLRAQGLAVDMVEPHSGRRRLAHSLGARQVFAPIDVPSDSYAYGFECSSRGEAFRVLQQALVPGGRICVLSDGTIEPLVLEPEFHTKELTIVGSSDGLDYHAYARWLWPALRAAGPQLGQLYEARIGRKELSDLFAAMAEGAAAPIKVLVSYTGE